MLIEILILFFIFLLSYQTYSFIIDNNFSLKKNDVIEGYTDYEQTSYMLSQKNAVNIQDLKDRLDNMSTTNNNYDDLNNRLTIVEQKLNNLINANPKGSNFDTNTVYTEDDEEEQNNGLPSTVDTSQVSSQDTGNIPPMDNLDNTNNNNNNMF
jgi:nitrogen fixation/metabolism regulation signal transduction histidine kinase